MNFLFLHAEETWQLNPWKSNQFFLGVKFVPLGWKFHSGTLRSWLLILLNNIHEECSVLIGTKDCVFSFTMSAEHRCKLGIGSDWFKNNRNPQETII